MYFEINVSRFEKSHFGQDGYTHFFATAKRSLTSSDKAAEVAKEFIERFPKPDFKISISCNPQQSWGMEIDEKDDLKSEMSDLANRALKGDH